MILSKKIERILLICTTQKNVEQVKSVWFYLWDTNKPTGQYWLPELTWYLTLIEATGKWYNWFTYWPLLITKKQIERKMSDSGPFGLSLRWSQRKVFKNWQQKWVFTIEIVLSLYTVQLYWSVLPLCYIPATREQTGFKFFRTDAKRLPSLHKLWSLWLKFFIYKTIISIFAINARVECLFDSTVVNLDTQ